MKDVVIVSAVRTPIGLFGGQFKMFRLLIWELTAVEKLIKRINLDGSEVDELILEIYSSWPWSKSRNVSACQDSKKSTYN